MWRILTLKNNKSTNPKNIDTIVREFEEKTEMFETFFLDFVKSGFYARHKIMQEGKQRDPRVAHLSLLIIKQPDRRLFVPFIDEQECWNVKAKVSRLEGI